MIITINGHSSQALEITKYLRNSGRLEIAQQMEERRCNPCRDQIPINEVEQILI